MEENLVMISAQMREDDKRKLEILATDERRSMSALIRMWIERDWSKRERRQQQQAEAQQA